MQAIPLGRINVPTAGTPVALTLSAAQLALLPPSQQVNRVEVWPDTQATGRVLVKCQGVTLAVLPVPTGGYPVPWSTPDSDRNSIAYAQFSLDAVTNGDGAYVTLWVA